MNQLPRQMRQRIIILGSYWRWFFIVIDNMAYMPYITISGRRMTEFTVIAYEKEDGESPVEDFINALDVR